VTLFPRGVVFVAFVAFVAFVTSACGFDHRSEGYACTAPSDCMPGRTCDQGWCVDTTGDGGVPDGAPVTGDGGGPDAAIGATVVVLGETPDADVSGVTADSWLNSSASTLNYGGDDVIRLDRIPDQNGLLRFDLTSIPAGTEVVAVALRMWTESGFGNDGVVQLYPVIEAWDEGDLDGAAGAASWNERVAGVQWLGHGATGASRSPTLSDDAPARLDGVELVFSIPAAVVQGWIDDPASNNGWVLVPFDTSNDAATLVSSESPVQDHRPRLIVTHF